MAAIIFSTLLLSWMTWNSISFYANSYIKASSSMPSGDPAGKSSPLSWYFVPWGGASVMIMTLLEASSVQSWSKDSFKPPYMSSGISLPPEALDLLIKSLTLWISSVKGKIENLFLSLMSRYPTKEILTLSFPSSWQSLTTLSTIWINVSLALSIHDCMEEVQSMRSDISRVGSSTPESLKGLGVYCKASTCSCTSSS